MAVIPTTNTARLVMTFDTAGTNTVNVWHVRKFGDPLTIGDLEDLAEWTETEWWDVQRPFIDDITRLLTVSATDVSQEDGIYHIRPVGSYGNATGDPSPSNVALVVSLKSQYTGRSNQGRYYLTGIPEEQIAHNTASPTLVSGCVSAAASYMAHLLVEGFAWGVVSFIANGVAREAGAFRQYGSIIVNNRIDTQRRRLPQAWS